MVKLGNRGNGQQQQLFDTPQSTDDDTARGPGGGQMARRPFAAGRPCLAYLEDMSPWRFICLMVSLLAVLAMVAYVILASQRLSEQADLQHHSRERSGVVDRLATANDNTVDYRSRDSGRDKNKDFVPDPGPQAPPPALNPPRSSAPERGRQRSNLGGREHIDRQHEPRRVVLESWEGEFRIKHTGAGVLTYPINGDALAGTQEGGELTEWSLRCLDEESKKYEFAFPEANFPGLNHAPAGSFVVELVPDKHGTGLILQVQVSAAFTKTAMCSVHYTVDPHIASPDDERRAAE